MGTSFRAVIMAVAASAVLTAQSKVAPAPEATFGFKPGADFKLANYDRSLDYFRALAASSKYVRLVDAGKTSQGRPMVFALISSPKNLDQIERYRQIAQRLAHPQGLTDDAARQLARDGKPIVHIDGGLHATEVAGPQHTPLLAYELISKSDDPFYRAILDNVILMLWPTINPDGQQMVADWYMSNVGTPYELSPLPQLYQEYVGHDNNRDAYMLNMIESRVVEQAWRDWEPSIVYVHHQSSPFPTRIWLPPFSEPIGSDAPFLMSREVNMIGMAIAKGLEERGQVGATHMGTSFDAWYPGYIDYAPNFKNVPAFWTETALFQYATPREYTIADFPESFRDLRPQSLYPSPWRPGWWRLGDAVAYMLTASLVGARLRVEVPRVAALQPVCRRARSDRARQGRTAIRLLRAAGSARSGGGGGDAAAAGVRRRARVAALRRGHDRRRDVPVGHLGGADGSGVRGVRAAGAERPEVSRHAPVPGWSAAASVRRRRLDAAAADGRTRRAGDDAADGRGARQHGAARTAAGSEGQAEAVRLGRVEPTRRPSTACRASGSIRIRTRPRSCRRRAGSPVRGRTSCSIRRRTTRSARSIGPGRPGPASSASRCPTPACATRFAASTNPRRTISSPRWRCRPSGAASRAHRSRVRASASSVRGDRAWTKAGRAGCWSSTDSSSSSCGRRTFARRWPSKVDVIVLTEDGRLPIEGGGGRGRGGAPGAAGGRGGGRSVRPEYADTVSAADLERFDRFIRDGGTLVCLGGASTFAIGQFKLPVRNAVANLRPEEFFLRGSIVEVTTDPAHPIMAGMPEKAAVFVDGSPVFETLDGFTGRVLAKYPESGSPLLSGYLIGETFLHGKAAALDVQLDNGHVVLLGFRPQWRGQPFGTLKVLFNAVTSSKP